MSATNSFGADTHVIQADHQKVSWIYDGKPPSEPGKPPLLVDDLKKGDIVEVQFKKGFPHGFAALNGQKDQDSPLVADCNDAQTKPDAVLKEICEGETKTTNYAREFGSDEGTLRLEVLDKFSGDFAFWCVRHKNGMKGILRLAP